MISDRSKLAGLKALHTLVWAALAGCVVAIPVLALFDRLLYAAVLAGVLLAEVVILALNGWQCPLTGVAARYTTDRRANFDIYLPEWLARHNKTIFGTLYLGGLLAILVRVALG